MVKLHAKGSSQGRGCSRCLFFNFLVMFPMTNYKRVRRRRKRRMVLVMVMVMMMMMMVMVMVMLMMMMMVMMMMMMMIFNKESMRIWIEPTIKVIAGPWLLYQFTHQPQWMVGKMMWLWVKNLYPCSSHQRSWHVGVRTPRDCAYSYWSIAIAHL